MKNIKVLPLVILPLLLLPSCQNGRAVSTYEQAIDLFNLDSEKVEKISTVDAYFIKNNEYVPYLTLQQYASFYKDFLDDGVSSSVKKTDKKTIWSVKKSGQLYFYSEIDYSKNTVSSAGSLAAALKAEGSIEDTAALYYGLNITTDTKLLGTSYFSSYSFEVVKNECISMKGDYYMPLGFFDVTYSFDSSTYFTYNYSGIYKTVDPTNYTSKEISNGVTVNSQMKEIVNGATMPEYLRKYNANLFFYLLDNFYGLKEYKNISSGVNYCKENGTYDGLLSENDSVRVQAYADTLAKLDDNHTALVYGNEAWGEEQFAMRRYGEGCINRSKLRNDLVDLRKSQTSRAYCDSEEILYSTDGSTAMFLFDSFVFGTFNQVFNRDGTIRSMAKRYDSFFMLVDAFETMKKKGGVKNVILDMSTNGGGVLGVLMKLLALISKTNKGEINYIDMATKQLAIATSSVNSNGDSVFNLEDCYGDDFKIFLLTSDCSFSCGNAFPFYAKLSNDVKIIGQKTGGGECAVAIHYLPNGEYVYHSSNIHIVHYDQTKRNVMGFEGGVEPDLKIDDYATYYNINRLSSFVSNL